MGFAEFNWLAVAVAALAIFAVGFIIYGFFMTPARWMAMARITQADRDRVGMKRMPYGAFPPILTAVFLALIFQWADVDSWQKGLHWGIAIALASAIPAIWYGWIYSVGPARKEWLDTLHLLIGHSAAGMIIGGWQ